MKHLFRLSLAALLFGTGLHAASLMDLSVPSVISGNPGDTIGWDFTLNWSSSDEWASITTSALINETNPFGIYQDFLGGQGGPVEFAIEPGSPSTVWSETFDLTNALGLGSYTIDPGALPFSEDQGQVQVTFDVYDGSPLEGGNYLRTESITAPFDIQVTDSVSTVPEPGSFGAAALGIALGFALRKRRGRTRTPA